MKNKDARSLSSDQQHLLRVKAVEMVFNGKFTQRATAKALGVSRSNVNKWCKAFSEGGYKALRLGRRGRKTGEQQMLKPHQCATIVRIITDKTPDQIKMPFVLWERVAVRELIIKRYKITLALRTISDYLKRWGMTAQRPVERAYEQNPKKMKAWLEEEYPDIKKRAKKEGATILWSDETGVQNHANVGKSFSPKGETPVIKKTGKKLRVNMISSVSNKGHVRFMIYSGKMNQQRFIIFLRRLIANSKKKIFVIVDNLSVHHGKKVGEWVSNHSESIELFFIPSYCPELNPDEYLNRDLKKNVHRGRIPRTQKQLEKNLLSFMRSLQKLPRRVVKYFNSPYIAYAKAFEV